MNLLILSVLLAVIFGVLLVVPLIIFELNRALKMYIAVVCPLTIIWIISILIVRFGCKTYDIYSEKGIKRVRRNKEIFTISWDEIKEASYLGIVGIFILSPNSLLLTLVSPHKELINPYDNNISETVILTPMAKKKLKQIETAIPIKINRK